MVQIHKVKGLVWGSFVLQVVELIIFSGQKSQLSCHENMLSAALDRIVNYLFLEVGFYKTSVNMARTEVWRWKVNNNWSKSHFQMKTTRPEGCALAVRIYSHPAASAPAPPEHCEGWGLTSCRHSTWGSVLFRRAIHEWICLDLGQALCTTGPKVFTCLTNGILSLLRWFLHSFAQDLIGVLHWRLPCANLVSWAWVCTEQNLSLVSTVTIQLV